MKRIAILFAAVILALMTIGLPTAQAQGGQEMARLRVIHASPDAPPVNVWVNDRRTFGPLFYKRVTFYTALQPGTYNIKVVSADQNQTVVMDTDVDLAGNTDYTIVAAGQLANIEPLVLTDNNQLPEAGQAKVRFVHVSPDAPAVDIATQDGTILFSNVPFKSGGDYLSVEGGRYNLEVRLAGTTDVVLEIPGKLLPAGTVSSIFAVGLAGGEPGLEALSGIDNRTRMRPPPYYRPYPPPRYHPPFCCRPPFFQRPPYFNPPRYYPPQGYAHYPPRYPPYYQPRYRHYNYGYPGIFYRPNNW